MKLLQQKLSFFHYIPFFYYALAFFTPLAMNSTTSEIFEFNKMMFIYAITVIVSSLYLAQTVLKKERFQISFLLVLLLLFLGTQIISTIYSIDKLTSVFGYYGRWNGGVVSISSYILLFFIFTQVFTKEKVITFLKWSLGSSAVVIVWGLLAAAGFDLSCYIFTGTLSNSCWTAQFNPAERMFSTIGQPNWLGAYLAFHLFVGVYFLLKNLPEKKISKDPKSNWILQSLYSFRMTFPVILSKAKNPNMYSQMLFSLYLVLNVSAIYLTKSRSSLLAVGVAAGIGALIVLAKRLHFKKKTEEVAILVFVLGIFVTFFVGWRTGYIQNFFALPTQTSTITDSFDIRKVVWKGAIDLGLKYPYFGSGVETYAYAYYFTRPAAHNLTSEWDFIYNKAHNEYLNYFATTGFIGVSGYMLCIIGIFILFWRYFEADVKKYEVEKDTLLATSLMLGFITILITNFFGFSVSTIQILFYLTPACIFALLQKDREYKTVSLQSLKLSERFLLVGVTVIFLGGIWYVYNYYTADIAYAQAKSFMAENEYQEALIQLDLARNKRYEHVYEDKLSYTLANLAFLYSFGDDKARTDRYILLADASNLRTLQDSPQNILYWRTRAKNYYLFYQITQSEEDLQKALVAFEEVVHIAPTDVQSRYTLALFHWIASREINNPDKSILYYDRALTEIRKVIDMRPNYIEAQELLGEMLGGS